MNTIQKSGKLEAVSEYYGCGLSIPEQLEGKWILDLGSGTDGIIDFSCRNPDYKGRLAPEVLPAAASAAAESDREK